MIVPRHELACGVSSSYVVVQASAGQCGNVHSVQCASVQCAWPGQQTSARNAAEGGGEATTEEQSKAQTRHDSSTSLFLHTLFPAFFHTLPSLPLSPTPLPFFFTLLITAQLTRRMQPDPAHLIRLIHRSQTRRLTDSLPCREDIPLLPLPPCTTSSLLIVSRHFPLCSLNLLFLFSLSLSFQLSLSA